jgi:2-oxoglutarate ferredoxin oxidoreductase subunit gamma
MRIAEELGSKLAANIVLLGYLVESTGVVSLEAMEEAIRNTVNPRHLDLDLRALDAGCKQAARP